MKFTRTLLAAALALVVAGCGKSPKAPQNTVAAVYIDASKAVDNIEDVLDDVLDALPSEMKEIREEVRKGIKEGKKELAEKAVPYDSAKWVMLTVTIDPRGKSGITVGIAACVKGADKIKSMLGMLKPTGKVGDVEVFDVRLPEFGSNKIAFIGDLILIGESDDAITALVKVYSGDEKPAPGFGDIDDLDGNTIARVLIPEVGQHIERFGLGEEVKTLAELTGDEGLEETIKGFGDLQLDVFLDSGDFGAELSITAATKADAKAIEAVFNLVALGARFGADAAVAGVGQAPMFRHLSKIEQQQTIAAAKALRNVLVDDTIEVDRSGKTSTLTIRIDTEDVIDAVMDNYFAK